MADMKMPVARTAIASRRIGTSKEEAPRQKPRGKYGVRKNDRLGFPSARTIEFLSGCTKAAICDA